MNNQYFSRPNEIHATWAIYSTIGLSLLLLILTPGFAAFLGFEDGLIENLSALLFFTASVFAVIKSIFCAQGANKNLLYASLLFLMGALFFIFAGEEISWGQRIFGIQTNDFFLSHNWQGEMNLHNIHTDISNIAYHYGAFALLIIVPLFADFFKKLFNNLRVPVLKNFIGPSWLAVSILGYIGMIDPRFIYTIEKPWAAVLYLLSLFAGITIIGIRLLSISSRKDPAQTGQLLLSLFLILAGLLLSFLQALDTSPNTISEYKELVIALGLLMYILQLPTTKTLSS